MSTDQGVIRIHAEQKLELTVGDTIKVVMNGDSGKIKVETDDLSVHASKKVKLEADGNIKISGRQVSTEATSMLKSESSGMLSLAGKPIKLG